MPVPANISDSTAINASMDQEFIRNFEGDLDRLLEVLGIFGAETIAAGTTLKMLKVAGELNNSKTAGSKESATGDTAVQLGSSSGTAYVEGDEVALSKFTATYEPAGEAEAFPYRRMTTHKAIQQSGYVNAVLNLLFDPKLALKNMSYLLKPGGILVYNGVLATRPRDEGEREQARRIGNAVQSAPERKQFVSWLAQAGFNMVSFVNNNEQRIEPSAGADEGAAVPVVETDEPVSFVSGVFEVCKDDHVDYHTQDLKQDISQFR